ncbi:hypothetical protein A0256_17615 [Mucilaginibacter sp. PAMC 26640]|nr:hypothetical protein A0256_17615 [Mucilaginibacter sp. PAMC 26640]
MNKANLVVAACMIGCLFSCNSHQKDESDRFRVADSILMKNLVGTNKSATFYLIADASCEFCIKNLEFYLSKIPRKERYIIYTTAFRKIRYRDLPVSNIVDSSNLVILQGYTLLENVAALTKDIKGPYKITMDKNRVKNISPLMPHVTK